MILNETRMNKIVNMTNTQTPKLASRSKAVNSEYIGISKFGVFNFRTTSQTHAGKWWYQTIEIPDFQSKLEEMEEVSPITARDLQNLIQTEDIKVFCDDQSFLYWGFKYKAWNDDYGIEPETRKPELNNVDLKGGSCKHLHSVFELINSGTLYEQMAKDSRNYLAYAQGKAYKNFSKTRLLGDKYRQKNRINWETYDSYLNDYFASKSGVNKFLDDEDIKSSLKAEIERTARTDPKMTLDDFITEEFSVDGIQGLANELGIDVDYIRKYFSKLGF